MPPHVRWNSWSSDQPGRKVLGVGWAPALKKFAELQEANRLEDEERSREAARERREFSRDLEIRQQTWELQEINNKLRRIEMNNRLKSVDSNYRRIVPDAPLPNPSVSIYPQGY
jgi:hypothetical protein